MNVPIHNNITGESGVKIAASIEAAIRDGRLAAGEKLPTVRALAADLGVSPTTVSAAYRRLQVRGVVVAEGRRGTRVCPRPPIRFRLPVLETEGVRNLASGNPDPALLPRFGRALAKLDPEPVLYGAEINLPELISLARKRFRADGVPADSVAVVGGAMDGIERVLREHLRTGDRVAVEDPGFPGTLDLVRGLGLSVEPVEVDDSGMLPDSLARAFESGAQAGIVTPAAQNPTGPALDARRVRELRRVLARDPEVLVIEDDHGGPVSGVRTLTLVDDGRQRWAVIRSAAKSLGPDLRLALLAGDRTTIAGVEGRQILGMRWVSHLLQSVAVSLWSDAATVKLLARAARLYSARRHALIEALARHGVHATGRSGFNVWIPVTEEAKTMQRLMASGWLVDAGERYRINSAPGVRVTVAALVEKDAPRLAADVARSLASPVHTAIA